MKQVDLGSYNNSWYKPGNVLKRGLWYFASTLFFKSAFPLNSIKVFLLVIFGAKVGKAVVIKPHVNIKYPWFLSLGDHVWIGEYAWIDNLAQVKLGNNVCVSQGALLVTGNHDYKKTSFDLITKPITLENGVWIGAKSVVCPGITARYHSVLTVGSVAQNDMDAYGVYSGVPALKIKDREIN